MFLECRAGVFILDTAPRVRLYGIINSTNVQKNPPFFFLFHLLFFCVEWEESGALNRLN